MTSLRLTYGRGILCCIEIRNSEMWGLHAVQLDQQILRQPILVMCLEKCGIPKHIAGGISTRSPICEHNASNVLCIPEQMIYLIVPRDAIMTTIFIAQTCHQQTRSPDRE